MRAVMIERRRSLSPEARRAAGAAVARIVLALAEFARADRIAAYVATADEVPTDAILAAVLASGRTLLLPRASAVGLEFAAVGDLAALRRGRWGVLEPTGAAATHAPGPGDLELVPGLAFDRSGGRLGRGAGHYDRVLGERGEASRPFCVGVGYAFQLVDAVPVGALDRAVDGVATESGFVRAASEPRDPTRDPG